MSDEPRNTDSTPAAADSKHLTAISVKGFKSIRNLQRIEIHPLTILAGANSSGKSSMIQPLLLFKQTLEATFDPAGGLLLNGPNAHFTDASQLLSRSLGSNPADELRIGLQFGQDMEVETCLRPKQDVGFEVVCTTCRENQEEYTLRSRMTSTEIENALPDRMVDDAVVFAQPAGKSLCWGISTLGPFLFPALTMISDPDKKPTLDNLLTVERQTEPLSGAIAKVIHVPGLRGNPERAYPRTAVESRFPGTFQQYTAGVIASWQATDKRHLLNRLGDDLKRLGLSWKIESARVSDAEVDLKVGRLPQPVQGGARDLVSIADAGFGVSQVLPVLVALYAAGPDHLVYIEQPEIHLHPRAQVALAEIFAAAVKRGVRMIIETHSPLLLISLQTLVAKGEIAASDARLHWFTRSETDGTTAVSSAGLNEAGAFSANWPEDFGEITLQADADYLDAADRVHEEAGQDA